MKTLLSLSRTAILVSLVTLFLAPVASCSGQTREQEARRLAGLLKIGPGSQVGEIGAGDGSMSLEVAKIVGLSGHVFANDLNPDRVADMRRRVEKSNAKNFTVVQGAVDSTNLAEDCCDALFIRRAFHHFTRPREMNRSLFRSLKPGGRLAVIDFAPGGSPRKLTGMPENRKNHGILRSDVRQELETAGFILRNDIEEWGDGMYCLVFQKPAAPANRP